MRMMSPNGTLGDVPEENVEAAERAGFRVMSDEDMKLMFNRISLEHSLFKDRRRKAGQSLAKRAITRMRGRRR